MQGIQNHSSIAVGMKSSSDSKKDKDSPFNTPLEQWKVDQVCKWFETQKLTTSTVSALRIAKVDGEKLLQLTRYPTLLLENFRELGVPDEELPAFELSVKNLKGMFAAQEKSSKKPSDGSAKKEERVQSPWADASVLSVSSKKNGGPSGSAPAVQDFVDSRGPRQKSDSYGRSSRDALVNEVVDEELRNKTKKVESEVWDVRRETNQMKKELQVLEEMEEVLANVTRKRAAQVQALKESRTSARFKVLPGGAVAHAPAASSWATSGGSHGSVSLDTLLGGNPRRAIDPAAIMNLSAGDLIQLGTQGIQTIRSLQADLGQLQVQTEQQTLEHLATLRSLSTAISELKEVKSSGKSNGNHDGPVDFDEGDENLYDANPADPHRRHENFRAQVRKWSPAQVLNWVEKKGFHGSVLDCFSSAKVSGAQLLELSVEDLESMGIGSERQRQLLYKAVQDLRAGQSYETRNLRKSNAMGSRPSHDHRSSGQAYSRRHSGGSGSDNSGDDGDANRLGDVDSSGLSEEHADTWTVDEVYAYLRNKKLSGESLLCIRDNDIDGQTLLSLQEKDILEMGLASVGMRKRLIKISTELNELVSRRKKREQGAAVRAVAVAGKMKRMGATAPLVPSWIFAEDDSYALQPPSGVDEDKCIMDWTIEQVSQWLEKVAEFHEKEVHALKGGKVDGAALLSLDNDALIALGIESHTIRKRLLESIFQLQELEKQQARVSVKKWSKTRVQKWLKANGVPADACGLFLANDIDGDQLVRLDANMIGGLGVSSLGLRSKLMSLISELRQLDSARMWLRLYVQLHGKIVKARHKVAKALYKGLPAWLFDDKATSWDEADEYRGSKFVQGWDYKQVCDYLDIKGHARSAIGRLRTEEVSGKDFLQCADDTGDAYLASLGIESWEWRSKIVEDVKSLVKLNDHHYQRWIKLGNKRDCRALMTLQGHVDDIPPGSKERSEFEETFIQDIASALKISPKRILIQSITPGSIKVAFRIMPDDSDSTAATPYKLFEELQLQSTKASSALKQGRITGASTSLEALEADSDRMDGALVADWTKGQVLNWIQTAGFERNVVESFRDAGINGLALIRLDHEDLFKAGVKSILVRKRILLAVDNLKEEEQRTRKSLKLKDWAVRDVCEYLKANTIPEWIVKSFEANQVDGSAFMCLESADLVSMGVSMIGARSKVEQVIAKARAEDAEKSVSAAARQKGNLVKDPSGIDIDEEARRDPLAPMHNWSSNRVKRWLQTEGIDAKTIKCLETCSGAALSAATHHDLQTRGVSAWSVRKSILDAIQRTRAESSKRLSVLAPSEWNMQDVLHWLRGSGFAEPVVNAFQDNAIDGASLLQMVSKDLHEIGIDSAAIVSKLEGGILRLRATPHDVGKPNWSNASSISPPAASDAVQQSSTDTASLLQSLGVSLPHTGSRAGGGEKGRRSLKSAGRDAAIVSNSAPPIWIDQWAPEDVAHWALERYGAESGVPDALLENEVDGVALLGMTFASAAAAGISAFGLQKRLLSDVDVLKQGQREHVCSESVMDWVPAVVSRWALLEGFDLGIADKFSEHHISGNILLDLDESALTQMGIDSSSNRLKILKCSDKLAVDEEKRVRDSLSASHEDGQYHEPAVLEVFRKRKERRAQESANSSEAARKTEEKLREQFEREREERRKEETLRTARLQQEAEELRRETHAKAPAKLTSSDKKSPFMVDWSPARVAALLKSRGFEGTVVSAFESAGVDGSALLEISQDDMPKLGLVSLGDQKRLARLVREVRDEEENAFVSDWTPSRVCAWLEQNGHPTAIVSTFKDHELSGDALLQISRSQLDDMGISAVGLQSRVLQAVKQLAAIDNARLSAPVPTWTTRHVKQWLKNSLSPEAFFEVSGAFESNAVRGDDLLLIGPEDFARMGIPDGSSSAALASNIQQLKDSHKKSKNGESDKKTGKSDDSASLAALLQGLALPQASEDKEKKKSDVRPPAVPRACRDMFVRQWNHDALVAYLASKSFDEDTVAAVKANGCDGATFIELTRDDLAGMGISSVGLQRRLLCESAALKAEQDNAVNEPVDSWRAKHVREWLQQQSVPDDIQASFYGNHIDGPRLFDLDDEDLAKLGVDSVGLCSRIRDGIALLKHREAARDSALKEQLIEQKKQQEKKDKEGSGIKSTNSKASGLIEPQSMSAMLALQLAEMLEDARRDRRRHGVSSPAGRRASRKASRYARVLAKVANPEFAKLFEELAEDEGASGSEHSDGGANVKLESGDEQPKVRSAHTVMPDPIVDDVGAVVRHRLAMERKEQELRELEELEQRVARREDLARREEILRRRASELTEIEARERSKLDSSIEMIREEEEIRRLENQVRAREASLKAAQSQRLRLAEGEVHRQEGAMAAKFGEEEAPQSADAGSTWVNKKLQDMTTSDVSEFLRDAGLSKAAIETFVEQGITGR
jgi:hypothetical protein